MQILLRVVKARLLLHYDAFPQAWFNVGLLESWGAPFRVGCIISRWDSGWEKGRLEFYVRIADNSCTVTGR